MARLSLSAVIITQDAAAVLPACLASVAFADEILVVDAGSRDATVEIARTAGAKIITQPWLGYGPQKQLAVRRAAHDWVLCLDADERVSEPLRLQILQALEAPPFYAYTMPRCNRFMGRWLRHGEGYPDLSLRLFHRAHGRWSNDPIHERVESSGPVGRLQGDILHESAASLADYLAKQNRYTTLQAQQLLASGQRVGVRQLLMSPLLRFIKFYLLRRGFLDGIPGLVHISIGCFNSFIKYAKTMAEQRKED
ncbi:MAG: glycosyltransferase family 2 protein [Magnetococcales bacterium]|nr:glycosyltransferase family 2 protein [Magnetococcales bacterium]